jgi:hypothetical protein
MPDGTENLVFYMLQTVTGVLLLVAIGMSGWAFKEVIRLRGENEKAVAERKAMADRLDDHIDANDKEAEETRDIFRDLRKKVDDLWKANGGAGRVRT